MDGVALHSADIEFIAMNMSSGDFKSFCEGMVLVWQLRAIKSKSRHASADKLSRVAFWAKAHSDYSHLCKEE